MLITHESYYHDNIRYGFFTKNIIGSTHRYVHHYENHQKNNKLAADIFGSKNIAVVEQQHTNKVILVNDYDSYCIADAQVTNKANIALGVQTADCVPILLADEAACVVAAIHAGWRGARSDIIASTIKKMQELGARNITAIIGPCIRQCSYEVDNAFYNNFIQESIEFKKFFISSTKSNHHMFDLPGYVAFKLEKAGAQQILDTKLNTYEDETNFFSYRKTTHNPNIPMGNLLSVIMLKF